MHSSVDRSQGQAGNLIGWCILGAAISQLPLAIVAIKTMGSMPGFARALLFLSIPTFLMLTLAGVGLIMRKSFGYWCAYLATFFGGIGGFKISYVPFLHRFVDLGPDTGRFFLFLNLILVAILVWEHLGRLEDLEWERRKVHRLALGLVLLAGVAAVSFGFAAESIRKGSAASSAQLPVIGSYFKSLPANGPVQYIIVHSRFLHSVDAAITGQASEQGIRAFADNLQLKLVDKPEAYAKILPRSRRWKLDKKGFPTNFAPPDLIFVGRPKTGEKAVIQIVWRKSDSRFTAEMLGSIVESEPLVAAKKI
jgi:hypothetical protein